MPNRREYIASVGTTTFLAGCLASQEQQTPTETSTPDDTENQSTNETTAGDQQEVETDFNLEIDTSEWFDEGTVAEFIVTNRGDVAIRQLELVVDWYDEDGDYLDWDSVDVPALGSNKSWYVHVERSTDRPVDSFEATASGIPQERTVPDGLKIRSSEVNDVGDVEGILSNTRSSEVGVSLIATVYDTGGWLTNVGQTTQRRIPAGADWEFIFPTQFVDADTSGPGDDIALFISRL